MPRGGAPDKAGNEYESLWGVEALLQILKGEASHIHIEPIGIRGVEYRLTRPSGVEYWQCKFHLSKKESWTLRQLHTEKVLPVIKDRLSTERGTFHFASNANAPDLSRLTYEVAKCEDYDDYRARFLTEQASDEPFKEIVRLWSPCTEEEAFEWLNRIYVHSANLTVLESTLNSHIAHFYDAPAVTIRLSLQMFYIKSALRKLDARTIQEEALDGVPVRPLHLRPTHPDKRRIDRGASAFIEHQQKQSVLPIRLPRPELSSLKQEISERQGAIDILLTGTPGGGKSTAGAMLVEWFRERDASTIAFRLDSIAEPRSTDHLGELLGLSASPVRVLASSSQGKPTVLFIDQLDAISGVSGRMQRSAEVIKQLIQEVAQARNDGHTMHVILACRQVDLDYDHRLTSLFGKNVVKASFAEFSSNQVTNHLSELPGSISPSLNQVEFLRTPLHLALFTKVHASGDAPLAASTVGQLFAMYWDHVRDKTEERAGTDKWIKALELITASMQRHQSLNIPRSDLDRLPGRYVKALALEGVIVLDNGRVRFMHEAFYDYCYARLTIGSDKDLFNEVLSSKQHLHVRSQVRQILNYLRDTDRTKFIDLSRRLLEDGRIRFHVKQLTAVVLTSLDNPDPDEINLLIPYLDRHLRERATGIAAENEDLFSARMFDVFHRSRTWFPAMVVKGQMDRWRRSWKGGAKEALCIYLSHQVRVHPDEGAALLSQWIRNKALARDQIHRCLFLADLHTSRNLFDLFTRMVDEGVLDNLRDHGIDSQLAKVQPAWYVELVASILKRWIALSLAEKTDPWKVKLGLLNAMEGADVMASAKAAADKYAREIIPLILDLSNLSSYDGHSVLQPDHLWFHRWRDDHPNFIWSLIQGSEMAFTEIQDPRLLEALARSLKSNPLATANSLLLHLYMGHPLSHSEEGINHIVKEPYRLESGLSDNGLWHGQEFVRICSPHCSTASFGRLEQVLLSFKRPGRGHVPIDAFRLCSALDTSRISRTTTVQLRKWNEQYPTARKQPAPLMVRGVHSPVPSSAAKKMTFRNWISAMRKHNRNDVHDWDNPSKGGADELGRVLEEEAKKDPIRFAGLWFHLPPDLHATYPYHLLRGLKENLPERKLLVRVLIHALAHPDINCRLEALEIAQGITRKSKLPKALLSSILSLATDPAGNHVEQDIANDSIGAHINSLGQRCVRGLAINVLANALHKDRSLASSATHVLTTVRSDGTIGVRASAIRLACNLSPMDSRGAVKLFLALTSSDLRLLTTQTAQRFLAWATYKFLPLVQPRLKELTTSAHHELQEVGGRMLAIAQLSHPTKAGLTRYILKSPVQARIGLASVANANLNHKKNAGLSKKWLPILFNDPDPQVRMKAAECFQKLWHKDRSVLHNYDSVIRKFLNSAAFSTDPTHLLYALEHSSGRLTDVSIEVCEGYELLRTSGPSTTTRRDDHIAFELVLRSYIQLKTEPTRQQALDIIDRLCLKGADTFSAAMKDFA